MSIKAKDEVVGLIKENRIIAIIRTDEQEIALKAAEAMISGGISVLEFSYTMRFAGELIKELNEKYAKRGVIIGAGTILDPETAKIAISSGAQFIISPYLNIETVKMCLRYRIACIPGAMTVKETADCMEAGADMVKVFPSELFGPAIIKAIKGPLPQAALVPTGGITLENINTWFDAGAEAVGIGTNLIKKASEGDYGAVTERAHSYVEKVTSYKTLQRL
ncbi:bifunctional 2-keto-4-hydroxyglutarate aldolase/2-keto-3-deoxy-6-phosphogluconate aldolase [Acetivibrio cellulolyticus]|uniref:bifunctional 2-keto-4-hydroxyglutarate aldolase/2-keto-3-deoxy-6-phosphogluconate aldolase n=1 Tax=Acetivibrio cellulolyticus TaxID=35830 RepID=UPI0001E2E37D|nr:bifunctional 2-keto-4-hydroxyglutarate aldolase/2-keto-3-deoxy-6-phosphogluconate aldolase [Acetivibrio cellulolyticus]